MEAQPIPQDVRSKLRHEARWYGDRWYLTVSEVMGIAGCGDSRASRYRAVILNELMRDYPEGPKGPKTVDGSHNPNGKPD